MQVFTNSLSFIIATKDRPFELKRALKSLTDQSFRPDEVIIIDGSTHSIENTLKEFKELSLKYLRCVPPSASKQRNSGLNSIDPAMSLVGFLDDDVVLEPEAVENMMVFWERNFEEVAGASFNPLNPSPVFASKFKSFGLAPKLGIYDNTIGQVVGSGFQSTIRTVDDTTFVQWIPTTAAVWKKSVFSDFKFDEWYRDYSYLEDLDFSYRVAKRHKLVVVAEAKYYHLSSDAERARPYNFGRKEVKNRIYFVRKHPELSLAKCLSTLSVRILFSLYLFLQKRKLYYLKRLTGNLAGLVESLW